MPGDPPLADQPDARPRATARQANAVALAGAALVLRFLDELPMLFDTRDLHYLNGRARAAAALAREMG